MNETPLVDMSQIHKMRHCLERIPEYSVTMINLKSYSIYWKLVYDVKQIDTRKQWLNSIFQARPYYYKVPYTKCCTCNKHVTVTQQEQTCACNMHVGNLLYMHFACNMHGFGTFCTHVSCT